MENIIELGRLLSQVLQEQIEEPENLSQMEQVIREQLVEIGRQALAHWLAEMASQEPERTMLCPHCGQEARYKRRRRGQLRTLMGTIRYQRSYYGCDGCRRGHYPLDQALGLRLNAMSAELERLAGMIGVQLPFGQGSTLFRELTLTGLSDHSLDKAAQAYGAEIEQVERAWQAEATDEEALLRRKREKRLPLRLYGAVDAAKVHLRGEGEDPWRDLKLGAWFEARGRPPSRPDGEWQIKAEQVTYYTDICTSRAFSDLLWATGVQRNAQLAKELVFLGDGAEWIWNIVAENFPRAVQILDWFHACEYLTPVAKVAFDDEEQQKAWVRQTKTALWEGRLDEAIAACWALADGRREQDPAATAANYFQKNRERMDYPAYRAQGYHIGSGTIESAAKQIGMQRMKVPGARWNEQSARRVAKARAAYLSGQWPSLACRRTSLPLAV
jgi:hypothetical protein